MIIRCILGTWNAWTLYQIDKRLDVLEQGNEKPTSVNGPTETVAGRTNADFYQQTAKQAPTEDKFRSPKNKISATRQRTDQPAINLMDPQVQEAIAKIAASDAQKKEEHRRKSKMEAYNTSVKYELEKFSSEKEYDTETAQNIEAVLNESTAEWRAVREQVREGEISWIDARTEFKAIGEETEDRVTEFISEEDYKELRSRLWGDWSQ